MIISTKSYIREGF